jgi:hypothetical protein
MIITITYRGNENEDGGHYKFTATLDVADPHDAELQGQEFATLLTAIRNGAYNSEVIATGDTSD